MITKKSINTALPRLDELRRSFLLPGSTGLIPYNHMRHLRCAMLDIDPSDGKATRCVMYGIGDALEYDHYHGVCCVDITEHIIRWMSEYDVSRKNTVDAIYNMIAEDE